ncbi:MAG: hypothetical protein MJZ16_13800 [Bacteroidales bacterium]|nr:hypothetical protein [Bacteroidales bacterium]
MKLCIIWNKPIVDTEQTGPYKGRSAHKSCFTSMTSLIRKDKKEKVKEEAKPAVKELKTSKPKVRVTEEQYQAKMQVIAFLEKLTGETAKAKTYKLTEDYCAKYGFDYNGILDALQYFYEYLDNPPQGDCIGIVPYIYDEAQAYMSWLRGAEAENSLVNADEIMDMYPQKRVTVKKRKAAADLIDISAIGGE